MQPARGSKSKFLAPRAWVAGSWAEQVVLTVADDGTWESVAADTTCQEQANATKLSGPVLPGLVNAHSHAFQRVIAGLTEQHRVGHKGTDDFWSWRDRMYQAANRIEPALLEAVACHLYRELLAGGYTQVCEFHYLHRDTTGRPYADPVEMSMALVRAAMRTGMGLTLLPTLYMRSGFEAIGLRKDQQRFTSTPTYVLRAAEEVMRQVSAEDRVNVGVAIHSLRAADPGSMLELATEAERLGLPIHIHISEQMQEVNDCLAQTTQRPIEWLLEHVRVNSQWNLVHATHATSDELQNVRARDAAIVLCPTTEANLGDGVFDLPGFAGGRWSIGSDCNVTRSWPEELRLLEYSQRISLQQRNVAPRLYGVASSAGSMLEQALGGGSSATGLPQGGLMTGQRADFLVLDMSSPALIGVPAECLLDAVVFSGPSTAFAETYVAGRKVHDPNHPGSHTDDFARVMRSLWTKD